MNQTIKKRIEDINNGIVPEGYKQTSFGVFPCDWETGKTYGDLFEFNSSLSKSREELGDEGHPYLHYGDMHRNSFSKVSYDQYSILPKVDISLTGKENCLMEDGDIVFLDASEDLDGTSRCVLVENPDNKPFFAGLHTIPAREKDSDFSKYYKQYITLPQFIRKQFQRLAVGFKVYGLNKDTIAKINYAYPKDKKEQENIAKILMQWDEMIELQEKYIQSLEIRKKIVMKKLLEPKDGCESIKLGDICKIKTGKLDANAMVENGEYPFFTCSKEIFSIDKYSFDCEALLMAGNGEIGDVKYYKGKFDAYQRTYVLFDFSLNIKYVMYYLLQNFDRNVMRGMQKSSMPYIKLELLQKADIYYNKNSIFKIVEVLERIDEEIVLQKEKLERLKTQRKALQQYLLIGIVKV